MCGQTCCERPPMKTLKAISILLPLCKFYILSISILHYIESYIPRINKDALRQCFSNQSSGTPQTVHIFIVTLSQFPAQLNQTIKSMDYLVYVCLFWELGGSKNGASGAPEDWVQKHCFKSMDLLKDFVFYLSVCLHILK